MTQPSYAGYVIVPLHLAAGFSFALIPASVYQPGYHAAYGGLVVLLVATAGIYGSLVRRQAPGFGVIWLQVLLAGIAVAVAFFTVEFSSAWNAILYLPIMGASLVACLVIGHVVRFTLKP
jgi:hypothetical protein